MGLDWKRLAASSIVSGVLTILYAAGQPNAVIEKPKARTVTAGGCRILSDGTFSGTWGPSAADARVYNWAWRDDGRPDARKQGEVQGTRTLHQ